jgi:hypothetical protein
MRTENRNIPAKHLLGDGHLEHITLEVATGVGVVDTGGTLEHLKKCVEGEDGRIN